MTAVEDPARSEAVARFPGHTPGEPGLWVFIVGDMVVFGLFFVMIVLLRAEHPDQFLSGQAHLHQRLAGVNTLVLLTSSLLVVNGVRLARVRHPRAWQPFAGAIVGGAVFAGVKALEYTQLLRDGHPAPSNDFFTYYFVFTAIHLGHMIVGMIALGCAIWLGQPGNTTRPRTLALEGIACYWHLVDLLWLMLFALLYLMP